MKSSPPPAAEAGGDLDEARLRAALRRSAELIADYLRDVGELPVMPAVAPGEIAARLPAEAPRRAESMDVILDDFERLILPAVTHWNHPGFLAYFAISGSGPGIVGEALTAALNVNAMLWRTGPAATELEERVCDWLRRMVGLPEGFAGHINDTASMSTLVALAAARHGVPGLDARQRGLAGGPPLAVYCSEEAHSSVDKAVLTLGIGLDGLRRLPVDEAFRLRPEALERAVTADRRGGRQPMAVVATAGTTSTTSVDPLEAVAAICRREGLWLHVDAAYAGPAAVCDELRPRFAGWERADSIVLNPHKWLFTPLDCSVLLLRRPERLKRAFSLVPDYLESPEVGVTNLMDFGPQLGRRFRALKLWMVIRAFGVDGLAARIRLHCEMARELASRIEADPRFELSAPAPFSLVCFRLRAAGGPEAEDRANQELLERVNSAGPVLLSHTRLRGRYVLRLAIGNLRTTRATVARAWELVEAAAADLEAPGAR